MNSVAEYLIAAFGFIVTAIGAFVFSLFIITPISVVGLGVFAYAAYHHIWVDITASTHAVLVRLFYGALAAGFLFGNVVAMIIDVQVM